MTKIMKKYFRQKMTRGGVGLLLCSLLATGITVTAQESPDAVTTGPASGGGVVYGSAPDPGTGTNVVFMSTTAGAQGGCAVSINGSNVGETLLNALDLNHDGAVTLDELQEAAATYFKLWDTNNDGLLSTDELAAGISKLLPTPANGQVMVARAINGGEAGPALSSSDVQVAGSGTAVLVSPGEMPTPGGLLVKRIMALADTNHDGSLTLAEVDSFLDTYFSQWDQNNNGSLDAQELAAAFAQLAMPDLPPPTN